MRSRRSQDDSSPLEFFANWTRREYQFPLFYKIGKIFQNESEIQKFRGLKRVTANPEHFLVKHPSRRPSPRSLHLRGSLFRRSVAIYPKSAPVNSSWTKWSISFNESEL